MLGAGIVRAVLVPTKQVARKSVSMQSRARGTLRPTPALSSPARRSPGCVAAMELRGWRGGGVRVCAEATAEPALDLNATGDCASELKQLCKPELSAHRKASAGATPCSITLPLSSPPAAYAALWG
jgi:hypothetical protein